MRKLMFIYFLSYHVTSYSQNTKIDINIELDSLKLSIPNTDIVPMEYSIFPKKPLEVFFEINKIYLVNPLDTLSIYIKFPKHLLEKKSHIDFLKEYVKFNRYLGNSLKMKHNDNYSYTLPYRMGKKRYVSQSFKGSFSHNTLYNNYAIDFRMKVGDSVMAARGGIVVERKDNSREYGDSKKFINKANYLTVMHLDGTFSKYVHLKYKSTFVKIGDTVKVGQPIALSGLTGFTTGPHLHFVVIGPQGISIPIKFLGYGDKILKKYRGYRRKK